MRQLILIAVVAVVASYAAHETPNCNATNNVAGVYCSEDQECCGSGKMTPQCIDSGSGDSCCLHYLSATTCNSSQTCCGMLGPGASSYAFCCNEGSTCCQSQVAYSGTASCCPEGSKCCRGSTVGLCCAMDEECDVTGNRCVAATPAPPTDAATPPSVTDAPSGVTTTSAPTTKAPTDSPTPPSVTDPSGSPLVGVRMHSCMKVTGDFGVFLTTADLRRALENALRNDIAVAFGLTDTLPFRPKGAKVTIESLEWDADAKTLRVCYFVVCESLEQAEDFCIKAGEFAKSGVVLTMTNALSVGTTGNSGSVSESETGVTAAPGSPVTTAVPTDAPAPASLTDAPSAPEAPGAVRVYATISLVGDFSALLATEDRRRLLEDALRNDIAAAFGLTGVDVTVTEMKFENRTLTVWYFVVAADEATAADYHTKAGALSSANVQLTRTAALYAGMNGNGDVEVSGSSNDPSSADGDVSGAAAQAVVAAVALATIVAAL